MVGPMPRIDSYDFGEIVIDGEYIDSDVVILRDKVVRDWRRLEGHRLQLPDVRDYLLEDADVIIIGTGYYGAMRVDEEVIKEFEKRGRRVIVGRTSNIIRIYNDFVSRGLRVIAFLHLTC